MAAALARPAGAPVRYAAVGDSFTAGVGAALGFGWVDWFRGGLHHRFRRPVQFTNLGFVTTTSPELRRLLTRDEAFQSAVRAADLITLCIGGNDLLAGLKNRDAVAANAEKFPRRWDAVCSALRDLNPAADVLALALYNPCPAGDHRRADWGRWIEAFNGVVRDPAVLSRYRLHLVDLQPLFAGCEVWTTWTLLGDIHPNGFGHKRIARRLLEKVAEIVSQP